MYEELVKRLRREGEYADLVAHMHGIRPISPQDITAEIARSWKELFEKAADAIEELKKAVYFHKYNSEFWEDKYNSLADEKWIPVTERLPKKYVPVLVYSPTGIMVDAYIGIYDGKDYFGMNTYHVTHWMPLPEPPKEET